MQLEIPPFLGGSCAETIRYTSTPVQEPLSFNTDPLPFRHCAEGWIKSELPLGSTWPRAALLGIDMCFRGHFCFGTISSLLPAGRFMASHCMKKECETMENAKLIAASVGKFWFIGNHSCQLVCELFIIVCTLCKCSGLERFMMHRILV